MKEDYGGLVKAIDEVVRDRWLSRAIRSFWLLVCVYKWGEGHVSYLSNLFIINDAIPEQPHREPATLAVYFKR